MQLKAEMDSEFELLAKNIENYKGSGPDDVSGEGTP